MASGTRAVICNSLVRQRLPGLTTSSARTCPVCSRRSVLPHRFTSSMVGG
jgi:hypothetical protein